MAKKTITPQEQGMYQQLGIDPHKKGVKKVFSKIIAKEFPHAFCVIGKHDLLPHVYFAKHSDGVGSKCLQRLLHYLLTKDSKVFRGDAADALIMNIGDVAACGFVGTYPYILTDIIGINSNNVDKAVIMREIGQGILDMIELYRQFGIEIVFMGGETADLPDQIRTYTFDMDVFAMAAPAQVIKGNIQPGDKIFGFASDGRAVWEQEENSGIMSNGLTMTRIVLMHRKYAKEFPYLCRPDKPFQGRFEIDDKPFKTEAMEDMTVSQAIMSPTRQYAIIVNLIIKKLRQRIGEDRWVSEILHGISLNTGGGMTKIMNLGDKIQYEKNMPNIPELFRLIQSETGEKWKYMLTTFNCGIGLDVIGSDEGGILSDVIHDVSAETSVKAFEYGSCERSKTAKNRLAVETFTGIYKF